MIDLLRTTQRFRGVCLVGRAIVEIVILDPHRSEPCEQDWGGPHYIGVMAVHIGPGLLALVQAMLWMRPSTWRRTPLRNVP